MEPRECAHCGADFCPKEQSQTHCNPCWKRVRCPRCKTRTALYTGCNRDKLIKALARVLSRDGAKAPENALYWHRKIQAPRERQ